MEIIKKWPPRKDGRILAHPFLFWHALLRNGFFSVLMLLFCLCDHPASTEPVTPERPGIIHVLNPGEGNDIRPALQVAWEMASPGDTLVLPAGNFVYRDYILFKIYEKPNIHIKGAGSGPDGTTLYRDSETPEFMMEFYGSAGEVQEAKIEVSNICFQAMKTRLFKDDQGTGYPLFRGIAFRACTFYLHDCRFQWFSNRAVGVSHPQSHGNGIIYNNEFIECLAWSNNEWSRGYGINVGVWGEVDTWIPVSPGTNRFVFIEDNYFSRLRPAVAGAQGALYVFRHNHVELTSPESAMVDMHGGAPAVVLDYPYSARFAEVYDNIFVATPEGDPLYLGYDYGAISFRGGEAVIHGNRFQGFPDFSIRLRIEMTWYRDDYYHLPSDYQIPAYPIPYQIGYESGAEFGPSHTGANPSDHSKGDVFIWNNFYDDSRVITVESPVTFKGKEYDYLKERRDYHFGPKPGYTPYSYPHPGRHLGKSFSSRTSF